MIAQPMQMYLPDLSLALWLGSSPNSCIALWCPFDFGSSYWILSLAIDLRKPFWLILLQLIAYDVLPIWWTELFGKLELSSQEQRDMN